MNRITRTLFVCLFTLTTAVLGIAQDVDPSGHWEGTLRLPNLDIRIEIDFGKNNEGVFTGTFGQPEQGIKGLPLPLVQLEGRMLRFVVKAGDEPATFEGQISDDGYTVSGDVTQGGYSIPFSIRWTGVARFADVPKSSAISKELEGTWNGVLEAGGRKQRLVLKMASGADGAGAGTIVSLDGSGVEIAIGITQQDSKVTIDVPSVGVSYVAVLNGSTMELTGTWTQGPVAAPLTFKRAAR